MRYVQPQYWPVPRSDLGLDGSKRRYDEQYREVKINSNVLVNTAQLYYKHAFGIGDKVGNNPGIVGLVNSAVS